MTTATVQPAAAAAAGTAHQIRHLFGTALHAVRAFGGAAFEVTILGRVDPRELGPRGYTPSISSSAPASSPASMMR
ncbi:hypothetical protein [Streptomyces sp. URMC 129]|uniref:hypothetical protein n=1 Tax=Streptomyces sp. URMC 129 TaxID=3423407 RepID=UPI003F1DA083